MTYSAYDEAASESEAFGKEKSLDLRVRDTDEPLLVIMGAEEQIIDDPAGRLAEYKSTVPGARTELIPGAGHSPNVEAPVVTAALVLGFIEQKKTANRAQRRHEMQEPVQDRVAVRGRP